MTYRNDLAAAHARIDVLERENRALENEVERLRAPYDWSRAETVEAPTVEAPTVEAPTVEAPKVEASTVEAPTVEAPTVEAPKVAAPMAMEPIGRAPVDLADLLGATRIIIFLFIVLNALVLDFAR